MLDHTAVQDAITRITEYWQVKEEANLLSTPQREKVLGLKFSQGEHARDTVTGQEVEIIGGIREIIGLPGPRS
jgi:hypothetical protein